MQGPAKQMVGSPRAPEAAAPAARSNSQCGISAIRIEL